MGTMSFGSRGSGSGMSSRNPSYGNYVSIDGNMSFYPYDHNDIENEVHELMKKMFVRAKTYMNEMFNNPYLLNIYSELFLFSSIIKEINAEEEISKRYNLDMRQPNFIFNLMKSLSDRYKTPETGDMIIKAVGNTLQKFLFKSVENDPNLVLSNGSYVVKAMGKNQDFWKSLSGHFLSCYAGTLYKLDEQVKIPNATFMVEGELEQRTNQVIKSYIERCGDQKENYPKLMSYIGNNWEWFKDEMTR